MLKELSYVIAVAEKGNVSKAAEALFISQPPPLNPVIIGILTLETSPFVHYTIKNK